MVLLTVSDGVSLSQSGRWKTASWHLFNKVGRLVNHHSHSVTPDAHCRLSGHVAQPDVVLGDGAKHEIAAGSIV